MPTETKKKLCVDCLPPKTPSRARKAKYPGPRCLEHHRVVVKARAAQAHERHVMKTYSISQGFYQRLRAYQGERCAICPNRGLRKRLGVDHDHKKEGAESVRGLLCLRCNQVLARFRDDPELFRSAIEYLKNPPAQILMMSEN
jgi:Recombination endonuclease VII